MTILKAAAHTLDQQTGLSFHGPPNVANLGLDDFSEIQHPLLESPQNGLDEFADYCLHTMDAASSEPMVSYIKQFQNRGRETGSAEPCKHAACSRTHPINECFICRGPHFVTGCWHVLGLPDGIAAIKDNFKKQHTANDGPWMRKPHHNNDRGRPSPHHDRAPRPQERPRVSAVIPNYDKYEEQQPSAHPPSYSTVVNNSV
jgi:hypothetical protein